MMIVTIAAKEGRTIKTIDIGGAYLNADISNHTIIMELDPIMLSILIELESSYQECIRNIGTILVKLQKALYGSIE
jgi:hypothetical protein